MLDGVNFAKIAPQLMNRKARKPKINWHPELLAGLTRLPDHWGATDSEKQKVKSALVRGLRYAGAISLTKPHKVRTGAENRILAVMAKATGSYSSKAAAIAWQEIGFIRSHGSMSGKDANGSVAQYVKNVNARFIQADINHREAANRKTAEEARQVAEAAANQPKMRPVRARNRAPAEAARPLVLA